MPNVFQTIAAVKKDLGAVDKNGKMKGFGQDYKFRGIDDVINALHVPMYTHGLVVAPRLRSITQEDGLGQKGNQTRTVVEFEWTIGGPEGDSFIAATSGEAMDTQDKGSNKAGTAAYKQLLTQLLAIPFETDDPDNYHPNPPGQKEESKPASKPAPVASKPAPVASKPAPVASKPAPVASKPAEKPAPTATTPGERKCPQCTYTVGTADPIKKIKGVIYHKTCADGTPTEKAGSNAPSADDIASIIDQFPGAEEA